MTRPKLKDLSSREVVFDIASAASEKLAALCSQFGHDIPDSSLRVEGLLMALAAYAVTGKLPKEPVSVLLARLTDVLWTPLMGPAAIKIDDVDPERLECCPEHYALLLARAVVARQRLDAGENLSPTEVAVLGGVVSDYIRAMARDGRIESKRVGTSRVGTSWMIPNVAARAFLQGRLDGL